MKVVFDTNTIVDILAQRKDFYDDSLSALAVCNGVFLVSCITSNTVTDIAYILHRYGQKKAQVKESLEKLLSLVEVFDVDASDCERAVRSPMDDFEDAVLDECAVRHSADVILTRNPKDFVHAQTPVITIKEFLAKFGN